MKPILIIGKPGSGKSTLAKRLSTGNVAICINDIDKEEINYDTKTIIIENAIITSGLVRHIVLINETGYRLRKPYDKEAVLINPEIIVTTQTDYFELKKNELFLSFFQCIEIK